jgi:hypothetical protein
VLKWGILPAAIAALLVSPSVAGAETTLVSGVTYQRLHLIVGGRPVVLHVVRAPPDGGLYQLEPVLSNGDVLGRQTVPAMQRATARRATSVGVNGDYFGWATGRPSGVFMRDGVLSATPAARRLRSSSTAGSSSTAFASTGPGGRGRTRCIRSTS